MVTGSDPKQLFQSSTVFRYSCYLSTPAVLPPAGCHSDHRILYSPFPFLILKMTEAPFRPREKLLEKQIYFQNIHKNTYLKGPFDKVTSVAIPLTLAATSTYLIARGIYNMSHGIGKKE